MALEPPVTLPRGTSIGGARSVAVAVNCQLCGSVVNHAGWPAAVRIAGGVGGGSKAVLQLVGQQFKIGIVRPSLQQQHRASRVFDSRAASAEPAEPAPTIATSYFMVYLRLNALG